MDISVTLLPSNTFEVTGLKSKMWSDYCYQNKGELSLNQSNLGSFAKRVAKNNSKNNGGRHKIHQIFLIDSFVLAITLVWKTVHTWAMTQIAAYLLEKTMQLTVLLKRSLLQLVQ